MQERIKTPIEMLEHWSSSRPDDVYLRQPRNRVYHDLTWRQVAEQVRQIAGALRHLGLTPGDRIALLSKNCAEWFVTDLALMIGGYISVPIYPTANAETIRYVLEHSEAKAIFVGKLEGHGVQDGAIGRDILRLALPYDTMPARYGWQQLLKMAGPPSEFANPRPDQVMTIVYTSGSTGHPKGVVQTFGSMSWAGATVCRDLGGTSRDRVVSYLPLAHITERAYIEMASLYTGGTVSFVESTESFIEDVKRARPTLFISVPRLWTLFRQNILDRVGERRLEWLLRAPLIRDVVKRRIRDGLGLTHARTLGCGSAPAPPSLLEWYRRVDMNITEAWGMTENCAYGTLNHPFDAAKIGSVGRPGLDCEVRASDEGELLFRSPGLLTEYYKLPDATADAFTGEGFFRTGDLCRIDRDGYVTITGRCKDEFKTAKGKYVAPLPIERDLARNGHVEASCVIGSGLPQPVALVQISEESRSTPRQAVRASLEATLGAVNSRQEPHARLDAIVVVDEPWTTQSGVLTPTLKIRRHVLDERFLMRVDGVRGGRVLWQDEL